MTPGDKNGANILSGYVIDGDNVAIRSASSFLADDPYFIGTGRYLATRSSDSWQLRPQYVAAKTRIAGLGKAGSEVIEQGECFINCVALTPDDTDGGAVDVYIRHSGDVELASTGTEASQSSEKATYAGQSADGSHVLFVTTEHLEPADAGRDPSANQLYERVGGQTRVVGLDSDEQLVTASGAVLAHSADAIVPDSSGASQSGSSDAISADGSTIFFESPDPALGLGQQLYARIDGEETVQVSASQCEPACGPLEPATFQAASDDGSKVYFSTASKLLNSDLDDTPDFYLFDLDVNKLTLVTEDCETSTGDLVDCGFPEPLNIGASNQGSGVIVASSDGRRLYSGAPRPPRVRSATPVNSRAASGSSMRRRRRRSSLRQAAAARSQNSSAIALPLRQPRHESRRTERPWSSRVP